MKAWPHSLPASLPAQAADGGLTQPCTLSSFSGLDEDVGEEHVDLVKLLARVLVQGGHGHGVGEHGLLGRDLVEDVHEDVDLVKLLARAPCRRRT